jgi:YVTN family beta-propeller protein
MREIKRYLMITMLSALTLLVAACGEREESASQTAAREMQNPQGRIVTANQNADNLTVIDVATDRPYASVATGKQPHHVLATPDGRELWVTLYGETRLQVFSADTLEEIASVDVGESNDDLGFSPSGDHVYVSLGNGNQIAVVDVKARKLIEKVAVGKAPHGVRVTPDGKFLLVTNTLDGTVSLLSLGESVKVEADIRAGVNPFEVIVTADSKTAYVSNFLGDSVSVVDLETRKTTGYIRAGKKPAMLAFAPNAEGQLWVANTGSAEVWLIDAAERKLTTRIPVGAGAHGTVFTGAGKLYVTNTEDNTVSVIDVAGQKLLATIPVGNYPNGLTFVPPQASQ